MKLDDFTLFCRFKSKFFIYFDHPRKILSYFWNGFDSLLLLNNLKLFRNDFCEFKASTIKSTDSILVQKYCNEASGFISLWIQGHSRYKNGRYKRLNEFSKSLIISLIWPFLETIYCNKLMEAMTDGCYWLKRENFILPLFQLSWVIYSVLNVKIRSFTQICSHAYIRRSNPPHSRKSKIQASVQTSI